LETACSWPCTWQRLRDVTCQRCQGYAAVHGTLHRRCPWQPTHASDVKAAAADERFNEDKTVPVDETDRY